MPWSWRRFYGIRVVWWKGWGGASVGGLSGALSRWLLCPSQTVTLSRIKGITPPTIGSIKGSFKLTNPLQAFSASYALYKGLLIMEEGEGSVHGRTTRRPCAPLLDGMSHSPKGREVANHFLRRARRGHLHSLLDRLRPPLCFELRLIPGPEARSGCG